MRAIAKRWLESLVKFTCTALPTLLFVVFLQVVIWHFMPLFYFPDFGKYQWIDPNSLFDTHNFPYITCQMSSWVLLACLNNGQVYLHSYPIISYQIWKMTHTIYRDCNYLSKYNAIWCLLLNFQSNSNFQCTIKKSVCLRVL